MSLNCLDIFVPVISSAEVHIHRYTVRYSVDTQLIPVLEKCGMWYCRNLLNYLLYLNCVLFESTIYKHIFLYNFSINSSNEINQYFKRSILFFSPATPFRNIHQNFRGFIDANLKRNRRPSARGRENVILSPPNSSRRY